MNPDRTDTSPAPEQLLAVIAADDARIAATVAADIRALEDLLEDDFVFLHGAGRVDTRSSYLEDIRSGRIVYTRLVRTALHTAQGRNRLNLVTDIETERVLEGNKASFRSRALGVWVKVRGAWKLASIATVPLA